MESKYLLEIKIDGIWKLINETFNSNNEAYHYLLRMCQKRDIEDHKIYKARKMNEDEESIHVRSWNLGFKIAIEYALEISSNTNTASDIYDKLRELNEAIKIPEKDKSQIIK